MKTSLLCRLGIHRLVDDFSGDAPLSLPARLRLWAIGQDIYRCARCGAWKLRDTRKVKTTGAEPNTGDGGGTC